MQVIIGKIRAKHQREKAREAAKEALRVGTLPSKEELLTLGLSRALFQVGLCNRPELISPILRLGAGDVVHVFKGACRAYRIDLVHTIIRNYGCASMENDYCNSFVAKGVYYACKWGAVEVVQEIMAKYSPSVSSLSMLWNACRSGCIRMVDAIVPRWAQLTDESIEYAYNSACRSGNLELIERIEALSKVNPDDGLEHVCIGGHAHLIDRMVRRGGKIGSGAIRLICRKSKSREVIAWVGKQNPDHWERIYYHLVDANLNNLVDVVPPEHIPPDKTTIMVAACRKPRKNWEMIGQLIEEVTPTAEIIHQASKSKSPLLVELLLERASPLNLGKVGVIGACTHHATRTLTALIKRDPTGTERAIDSLQEEFGSPLPDPPVGIYRIGNAFCPFGNDYRIGRFVHPDNFGRKEVEEILQNTTKSRPVTDWQKMKMTGLIINGCRKLCNEWNEQIATYEAMANALPLEKSVECGDSTPTPWRRHSLLSSEIGRLRDFIQVVECYIIALTAC